MGDTREFSALYVKSYFQYYTPRYVVYNVYIYLNTNDRLNFKCTSHTVSHY